MNAPPARSGEGGAAGTTIGTALAEAARALDAAGVPDPRVDAEWLLADVLRCGRTELALREADALEGESAAAFAERLERRRRREPLQHILGWESFHGLRLKVDRRALIPRPETEELVERVLAEAFPDEAVVLDVGTGSGCIPIALARARPRWTFLAVDRSPNAVALARENVDRHRLGARVAIRRRDLRELATWGGADRFDLIVSNPPYVSLGEWEAAQPEVRDHEPRAALVAGVDGLDAYRALVPAACGALRSGGRLALEIGWEQGDAVAELLRESEFEAVRVEADGAGRPRFVFGTKGDHA